MELHCYDFDGTLFRSPDAPSWFPDGWFMSEASLGQPCVPNRPKADWWILPNVIAAKKSLARPDVITALVTGRSSKVPYFRWRVPELLGQAGLDFDFVHLNPTSDTPTFKANLISELTLDHKVSVVHLWDDFKPNMVKVSSALDTLGVPFVAHLVHPQGHTLSCGESDLVRLVAEGWLPVKVLKSIRRPSAEKVARFWLGAAGEI